MPRVGTGRVYQRGGVWWVDYSFRGERKRESSESKVKADATRLLRKRLEEMGRGKLIGPTEEKVTFEDLAKMIREDYKVNGRRSTKRLNTALAHLTEFFGSSRALDITTDRVRSYIVQRQGEGATNSSIQKELAALKRAFRLANQAGRISSPPYIPMVKVRNTRTGFFTAAEVDAVCTEIQEPLRSVVRFAFLTGWRKAEVLSLQWSQVDFEAGEVRLWTSKNNEPRVFPFNVLPPLRALLEERRDYTSEVERATKRVIPYVFHRKGSPILSMDGAWRAACKRAGLEGAKFHDLRRSAVRSLEAAGVSRSVAMKLTGHKTEAVYRRYAIADSVALSEGVEKLARLHAGRVSPIFS